MLQIHKASAGSGKTYTLTRQYLQLLLGEKITEGPGAGSYRLRPLSSYGPGKPKHHGSILAVTFTNKATEEMISRIIGELAALSGDNPGQKSPYLDYFLETFGTDPETLARHAATALRDLLFNYSQFNVSTIDSFFQRVLNTFTRELDLSPSHALELDDAYPIQVAVASMLSSVNINIDPEQQPVAARQRRHLIRWLEDYMKNAALEGDNFNLFTRTSGLFRDITDTIRLLYNETYRMHSREINEYLADPDRIVKFTAAVADTTAIDALKQKMADVARELIAMNPPLLGAKIKGSATGPGVLQKIVNGELKFTKTFIDKLDDPMSAFNKPSAKKTLDPTALDRVATLFLLIKEYIAKTKLRSMLLKWVYYLGLFGQTQRFLDDYRNDNDTLLLSDTNDLLARIIDEQETPFIYERMGTAIRHYLIDEFQDTSLMQWENLKPLVLESLARSNDDLIIGDEKQCIYRFRNSDPTLLGTKVESLVRSRFPSDVEIHGVSIDENCNWRSAPEVVRFNNSVFAVMSQLIDAANGSGDISATYAGLVQKIGKKNLDLQGYVKAFFIPKSADAVPAASDGDIPGDDDELIGEEEREATADGAYDIAYPMQLRLMKREIMRQLAAGYRPSDIAVLVRRSKEGKAVIQYLMDISANDPEWTFGPLNITSADSMAVDMSPSVTLIINVLRTLADPSLGEDVPADSTAAASYLRYRLIHRFHLETHVQVPVKDPVTGEPVTGDDGKPEMRESTASEALLRAIRATSPKFAGSPDPQQQQIDSAIAELASMDSPTLISITDSIISRFITPEARRRENPFITAFQDLVIDFSDKGENSVHEFLEWWNRAGHRTAVQTPEGLDALKVMTIHKSKGLEFPCVHVPNFSQDLVSYHTPRKKSFGWYTLDPEAFPNADPEILPPLVPLPNTTEVVSLPLFAAEGQRWVTEQKTDTLNVAYVALTRAVRELCVYVNNFSEGSDTIGNYLSRAIQALHKGADGILPLLHLEEGALPYLEELAPCLTESKECAGMSVLEYGKPTAPAREPEAPSEPSPKPSSKTPSCDRAEEAAQSPEAPPLLPIGELYGGSLETYSLYDRGTLRASTDFEDVADFNLADERQRGNFLHEVLSHVGHRDELERALRGQAYRYGIPRAEADTLLEALTVALADPRAAQWFEGYDRVANERRISDALGTRRPDRIVFLPSGEVHVVDYKFGAADMRRYHSQVRGYTQRLRRAGYPAVRGFLWFPLTSEIIEVKS